MRTIWVGCCKLQSSQIQLKVCNGYKPGTLHVHAAVRFGAPLLTWQMQCHMALVRFLCTYTLGRTGLGFTKVGG
jgi:hypothetical protein